KRSWPAHRDEPGGMPVPAIYASAVMVQMAGTEAGHDGVSVGVSVITRAGIMFHCPAGIHGLVEEFAQWSASTDECSRPSFKINSTSGQSPTNSRGRCDGPAGRRGAKPGGTKGHAAFAPLAAGIIEGGST